MSVKLTARSIAVALLLALSASATAASTTTLAFDAPVGGTVNDVNGDGTGFTGRLAGTGGSILTDDPNLSLSANLGKLTITSTRSDLNPVSPQPRNLATLEAPGLFFTNVGTKDIQISADFENVSVPNASDQLMIYVGIDQDSVFRTGFHDGNHYVMINNSTGTDVGINTPPLAFNAGDDVSLSLTRTSGDWMLAWTNHTTPANSGSLGPMNLPWASNDLWIGVHAANALNPTSFVGILDNFSVTVVPEPSTGILVAISTLSMMGFIARNARKKKKNCAQMQ